MRVITQNTVGDPSVLEVAEVERDGTVLNAPLVQARLADAVVTALVFGFPHNYSRLVQSSAAKNEPKYLRRAEE